MKINLLGEKITFQRNMVVVDEAGNHTNDWVPIFSCHCTPGGESGQEIEVAGQTVVEELITFTVRYSRMIDHVTTDKYRILFKNQIYDITAIDHMNYRRKSVKCICRRIRR